MGSISGGLIGHSVGGRHATGETVAGAAVGAAAGSAIGCEAQRPATGRGDLRGRAVSLQAVDLTLLAGHVQGPIGRQADPLRMVHALADRPKLGDRDPRRDTFEHDPALDVAGG